MIVRSLDINGDWNFGKGKNDYLKNNKAIVQNISTRLSSFLGDCFFATDAGIDWFNLLGSKNQLALELAVRAVILNTLEVTRLVDVSIQVEENTRRINMRYVVDTIYTVTNGDVPIPVLTSFLLTESGDILTTESDQPISTG